MKYKYTLLLLVMCLASCMQEPEPDIEPIGTQRNVITALEAPKLATTLNEKLGIGVRMSEYSAYTDQESLLVLDLNDIHQVIDTLGNETYTIRVLNEIPNQLVFYNLVLKYSSEGEALSPFLMRYEMEEETYLNYISTGDISNFKGTMQKHYLDNVGITIPKSSSSDGGFEDGGIGGELPGVDSNPCPPQPAPGSGGNDDGLGSDPTPPSAGAGCSITEVRTEYYSKVCDSNGNNCGPSTYLYTTVTFVTECNEPSRRGRSGGNTTEVCEQVTEEIPVLKPIPFDSLNLIKGLDLSELEDGCLKNKIMQISQGNLQNSIINDLKDAINYLGEGEFTIAFDMDDWLSGSTVEATTNSYSVFSCDISFNPDLITLGSSEEFIVSTIYHKYLHALFIFYEHIYEVHDNSFVHPTLSLINWYRTIGVPEKDLYHTIMDVSYMSDFSEAMKEIFPNLESDEINALVAAGVRQLTPTEYSIVMDHKNGNSGSRCN